jgi:chaperonin GroEL
VEGYQIQKGAESRDRFFNSKDMTYFEATDVKVVIYDGKIVNAGELLKAFDVIVEANGGSVPPILIMANEFSHEVIQFLLIQKAERGYPFVAVKGPHTTNIRSGYYDDMAVMLGGTRLGNGSRTLANIEADDVGSAQRVRVDKYTTTFYDGDGAEELVIQRVDQLKALKAKAESAYDAQVVGDRIAALTQGIAKIGVGGATELEIKEKYDRIEDALNASRAAIQEGIIPGGGATLLRIARRLSSDTIGRRILKNALAAPFFQILENIGYKISEAEINQILESDNLIYDARNKKVVDALEAGIIDPVKVTRTALENATSIAALLSTAGGGIVFDRRKQ